MLRQGLIFSAAMTAILPTVVIGIIAFMTGSASCCLQRLRVTIAARGAAMIYASPAFVGNAGVRTVVWREPVLCGMAGCTVQAKHARVEGRVTVTAHTVRR